MDRRLGIAAAVIAIAALVAYGYSNQHAAAKQTLASASTAKSPAPQLAGVDLAHKPFSLASFAGKRPIVINFMQASCVPCRKEAPAFATFADEIDPRVATVAIGLESSHDELRAFAKRFGWTFPIVPTDLQAVDGYQIAGYPVTVVIDRHGDIVYRQTGPVDFGVLRAKVRELT